jgi:hypothetical protein
MRPTLVSTRPGRTTRAPAARHQLWPIFRGLTVLQRLNTPIFHHEARNLAFMLKAAAYRGAREGIPDGEAVALAEHLLFLFPALPIREEDGE